MYASELSTAMAEDRRKSMRTSAIIHIILILLALLPFLRQPEAPRPFEQAVLVDFGGSSSEGAQKSAAAKAENDSPDSSPSSEEAVTEEAVEEEVVREEVAEVKPVETKPTTPVLTSEIEPPVIKQTKVQKVEVKTTPQPTETLPTTTEVKDVPKPTTQSTVLKPSKVKKVVVKIERPTSKAGSGSGGSGTTKGTKSGGGSGGDGAADTGKGSGDGSGTGKTGSGQGDKGEGGSGKGSGNGEGDDIGDGILTRELIRTPDLTELVQESGKISFNICVDRTGKVVSAEFNKKYSTIKDMETIRKALRMTKDYVFEVDKGASERECGRTTIVFKVE